MEALLKLVEPDASASEAVWDSEAIAGSIHQWAKLFRETDGYVYVDRDRDLKERRRETQGVLTGGEAGRVPSDKATLFMLRTKAHGSQAAAWWPQLRFPDGNYAFAFSI